MLKEIALALTTFLVLNCSTPEKDTANTEINPVSPIESETAGELEELRSSKVAAHERGGINVAVENWSQPTYPDKAKKKRIEGVVLVRVTIGKDGRVSSAKAESGHPLLVESAQDWAKGRRITPQRVRGEIVSSSGILVVKFGT